MHQVNAQVPTETASEKPAFRIHFESDDLPPAAPELTGLGGDSLDELPEMASSDAQFQPSVSQEPSLRTGPSFEPVGYDHQIIAASREIIDASRESMDVTRGIIQAQPVSHQFGTDVAASGKAPALSNYYGDVTINYVVTPNGQNPNVTRVNFAEELPIQPTPEANAYLYPDGYPDGMMYEKEMVPCCECEYCCNPVNCHRFTVFADALYWQLGNMDVPYAREQVGCPPGTVTPTGRIASARPDPEMGVRVGLAIPCSPCSSIVARYTWFRSDTTNVIEAATGSVLASLVIPPGLENCGTQSLAASASFDVMYQRVDLDYRRLLCGDCDWAVNWFVGARYAHLGQTFGAEQITGASNGLTNVTADVDFDGLGIGLGLDGMFRSSHCGFFAYGRGELDFLGGDFRGRYLLRNQFDGGVPITQEFDEYRFTTLLEGELGLGWEGPKGHLRLMAGLQVTGLYNALLMKNYLNSVSTGELGDHLDDTLSLSGLVARVEWRH